MIRKADHFNRSITFVNTEAANSILYHDNINLYKHFPYDKISNWQYLVWLIHWKNCHWAIYLADNNMRRSTLLDPSDSIPNDELLRIKDTMNKIVQSADPINCNNKPALTDIPCTDVPKQTSGSECGIFVCQYINDFLENPIDINFKMPQIQNCRNIISQWVNETFHQNHPNKPSEPIFNEMLTKLQLHQVTITELLSWFSTIYAENLPKLIPRPTNNRKKVQPLSKCSYQLQHLFNINPAKAIADINRETLEIGSLSPESMDKYFLQQPNLALLSQLPHITIFHETFTYHSITKEEIIQAIKDGGDKAPGKDKITNKQWLKWMEFDSLNIIYDFILTSNKIPEQWCHFPTKLIIKSGKHEKSHLPENWRPIASMPTSYRIFSKIINDRIMRWIRIGGLLNEWQKAINCPDGCDEHNYVIMAILERKRRNIKYKNAQTHILFLDLADAFGSIPYNLMWHTLEKMGLNHKTLNLCKNLYKNCSTFYKCNDNKSSNIALSKGVKQGCPISMSIFCLCINFILDEIISKDLGGIDIAGTRVHILAYADDLAIFAPNGLQMKQTLNFLVSLTDIAGLTFRPEKCGYLRDNNDSTTNLEIYGKPIKLINNDNIYSYLGVPMGGTLNKAPLDKILQEVQSMFLHIGKSILSASQKIEAFNMFLNSKLPFHLKEQNVYKANLTDFDLKITK